MYSPYHYQSRSDVAREMSQITENKELRDSYLKLSIYWGDMAKSAGGETSRSFRETGDTKVLAAIADAAVLVDDKSAAALERQRAIVTRLAEALAK